MPSTRRTLEQIGGNLDESMGVRSIDSRPKLAPVPHRRDFGRRPLRNVGQVDINMVVADPTQPRQEFAEESIEQLAKSIREKGQLSAIRVRWSEELGKWVIIAGERRWRAAMRAGLPTIDCYFHEVDLSESEVLEQQLIENCLREDLQPVEEARAFARLIKHNGWTGKQLAEALRIPETRVSRTLALLKLPDEIQQCVDAGRISARAGYELSKLPPGQARDRLAHQALSARLTHDQTAKLVRHRKGARTSQARPTKLTFSTPEGWRIVISSRKKGSYHEIEEALVHVLEEVRLRINNNVQIF